MVKWINYNSSLRGMRWLADLPSYQTSPLLCRLPCLNTGYPLADTCIYLQILNTFIYVQFILVNLYIMWILHFSVDGKSSFGSLVICTWHQQTKEALSTVSVRSLLLDSMLCELNPLVTMTQSNILISIRWQIQTTVFPLIVAPPLFWDFEMCYVMNLF